MNTQGAMNALSVTLKILGGAPYLLYSPTSSPNWKLIAGNIYATIVALGIFTIVCCDNTILGRSVNVADIYVYISLFVINVSYSVCLMLSVRNGKSLYEVKTNIEWLESFIRGDSKGYRGIQIIIVAQVCTGMSALIYIYFYISSFYPESGVYQRLSLSFCISEIMIFLQNVMFGGVVRVLRLLFLTVNCGLESSELRNNMGGSDVTVANARRLIRLHVKLCEAVEMVNSTYRLQIVLWVITSSLSLTHVMYSVSYFLLFSSPGAMLYTMLGLWGGVHVCWLWITIHGCQDAAREANRAALIISRILTHKDDAPLIFQLQQYSLQLLNRKIQFTGFGLFPLDHTLLYNIVGAITTYTVILIQFKLAEMNT